MNRKSLYGNLAKLYDDFYPNRDYFWELRPIIKIFKKHNVTTVIDIGCGTGEHAKILSKEGFKVTGIDASKSMINVCKNKNTNKSINFYKKKMQNFKFKKNFDAGICLFSTILYNTTNEQLLKTLKNIKNSLKPHGILVLRYCTPKNFTKKNEIIKGKGVQIHKHEEYFIEKQISKSKNEYFTSSGKKLGEDYSTKRILFPQETKFFAKQAGFMTLEQKIVNKKNDLLVTLTLQKIAQNNSTNKFNSIQPHPY